jgi:serine/threonine protein kinase
MTEKIGPFILGETLGEGSTGKVKAAVHKDTGEKVAIKIINKAILTDNIKLKKKIEREIDVMKLMKHKHVIKLYDVLQSKKYLFLIIEHVEGGELFDYIVKKGRLSVEEAFHFFKQIIEGIEYCHQNLICHRDLKPENLLLDKNKNIKIADFGMASFLEEDKLLETSCGSPHYASPEVVKGLKYNGMEADVWSCGVILFALLTGRLPFDDENIQALLKKVKSGQYTIPSYLTGDVKDLIQRMLAMDPEKRITIPEIKRHPWWRRLDKHMTGLSIQGMTIPTFQQLKEKRAKEQQPQPQEDEEEVVAQILKQEEEEIMHKTAEVEDVKTPAEPAPAAQEEIDPDIIRAMDQLGWGDIDRVREGLANVTKNIETVMYNLLKKRKEETGDLSVESYHPKMSVSSTNPIEKEDDSVDKAAMLRRKLMEAILNSDESVPGSPPSGKGMQWFAFWKKKLPLGGSPKEKVTPQVNSHFGLHSNKSQQEIMNELSRAFKVLQIQWSMVSESTIRAKCDIGTDKCVELDITMSTIPDGEGFFLNFNKVSGEIYAARVLFDVLQQELKI